MTILEIVDGATPNAKASVTTMYEVRVTARRTGGVSGSAEDGAAYIIRGAVKNNAGTVAFLTGSPTTTTVGESQAGWDATLDISGSSVRVRVTGATSNNITWNATVFVDWVDS